MRLSPAALAGAAALLLAACASSGTNAPAATSPAETASGVAGQLATVTVGVIPIVDTAPIRLGIEEGIFAEHGLELELTDSGQGGAATIPGVVSGQFQFGFSNTPALISAHSQGLDLPIVAPGAASTGVAGEDTAAIVVPADSDITDPAALAGRTVAVNTMKSVGDSTVRETVAKAGGDPDAVKFVEIAFPDMLAALAEGQVDAAWVVEPFSTLAQGQGNNVLASNYVETSPTLLIAAYFTSATLMKSDPDLVERFSAAMSEAQAFAQEHPDRVRAVLGSYMKIDPAVADKLVLPRFPDTVDRKDVEFLVDFAQRQGITEDTVDPAALLP
ncbi:ABC transporter substrate-binding protein [Georgenia thermotolerans]|uniref:Transporter substrate-binding domain-containing protein n=1 Tax=Georgenia thermotolerans TaxID=527326 RepID=A0A7J5UTX4_9MICO|nr:ABC transporter substrate-binding protein [Georgenia thermotolerans]KAE8765744.1 transporter substrate-binding domain-containing protein [Georgenia thermotolerans]